VLAQVVRQNGCRYAKGVIFTFTVLAMPGVGRKQQFAWVDKVLGCSA
jgi:hypothetical protein